jgi:hypothetical protein
MKNEYFTVYVDVQYSFENETLLTPGVWDAETEELYKEYYDWVEGEGTKRYILGLNTLNNTGVFHMEATAFYLVSNEWLIDDGGFWSFDLEVMEPEPEPSFPLTPMAFILLAIVTYTIYKIRSRTI